MLAFPMLVNSGYESFRVKETRTPEEENPSWGNLESRGAYWETGTAMSLLAAGADLLIMYHPQAVETVKKKLEQASNTETGE